MLEKLSQALKKATDKIGNAIFLDKNLVDTIIKDLQRALIEADVNIMLVKQISDKLKKTAYDENIKRIEKKEQLIKALHDELINILGQGEKIKLDSTKQNKIMFLGLYGAGKTTTISKLANYYSKRGFKVAVVGLDVHRPAAPEQLKQLSEKLKIPCFIKPEEKNPLKIWKSFQDKLKDYNLVLVDTAGRHDLDKELVDEIKNLDKEINPTEKILVMPADIGQAAKKQAQAFKDAVNITGVIITRMDSTAKGGGALTACSELDGAGVYFITTGEKVNDIEEFDSERFLSRLLRMGDLQSLIEKIQSVTDEKEQKKLQEKLEEGKLSLEDVVQQVESMNSLGGFGKLKSMIPGMGKAKVSDEALEKQQEKIQKWKHILNSLTKEEKENPGLLEKQTSRIKRIAQGSGVHTSDVRSLLKQYKMLQELTKSTSSMDLESLQSGNLSQKQLMKLAKKFGKKKFRM